MFSRLNGGVGREPAGMAIWGVLSWSYKRRHKERNQTPQFGPKSWPWASCMAPSPVVNENQAWAPGGTCSCLGSGVPNGSGDTQRDILWGLGFPSTLNLKGKLVLGPCFPTYQPGLISKMVIIISISQAVWGGKEFHKL